jgi:endonuclease III related protein
MPKNFSRPGKKLSHKTVNPHPVIYALLRSRFGPRDWWPADTPFEVMVGAILTQNTSWLNVERAINNLKRARALSPKKMSRIELDKLEQLVRPSGYFRQKAKRLKIFLEFFFAPPINGSLRKMRKIEAGRMREMLLSVKGIGPETADSILLYALDKPVFVVDAYTRRIFSRLGLVDEKIGYEELKAFFEKDLPSDAGLYNDYHAQLVALGNQYCKKRALCKECPLLALDKCRT